MSSTAARNLAKWVVARRDELDLSQLDVWQAGGPSNTTLTEIENGRIASLTRTTARKLDAGLRWEAGSAKRVWEGGEPVALGGENDGLIARVLDSSLPEDLKRHIVETIRSGSVPPSPNEQRGTG